MPASSVPSARPSAPTPVSGGSADIRHLRADGISHSYGDRRVLTGLDLVVSPGQRLGLIGENGVGKSTLLRLLSGVETPDAGTLTVPPRTGLLRQEVRFRGDASVDELIEGSLRELRAIEAEVDSAAGTLATDGGARYARALAAAEAAEVWTVDARRDALRAGLGVADIALTTRLDEVSGGQRSRFALAALLLGRPTALLLDEPTNHLDDAATEFLSGRLRAWEGPVVFASHDRAFLDEVATGILDIDPARSGATRFGGGYSSYLAAKEAERARWEAQHASEQRELAALEHSVAVTSRAIDGGRAARDNDKMGYDFHGGKVSRQVSRRIRNARGRLDELSESQVRRPPAVLRFAGIPRGSTALPPGEQLIGLNGGAVEGRLSAVTLSIAARSSLLITGLNGAGKSTLLSVLAGRLPLDSGFLTRRRGLRVALLEQDVRFAAPTRSCRELYVSTVGESRADALPLTSLGLIAPRDVDRPVGSLSVGQQRRLALALILARPPHLFLLDEPTNHLSLSLATELEDALGEYPGAVVVASHDRWLRRRWQGDHRRMTHGRLG